MRIETSSILMDAKSFAEQNYEKSESLNFWIGERQDAESPILDIVDISDEAQMAQNKEIEISPAKDDGFSYKISDEDKNKILLLEKFMEKVTGKKMIFRFFSKLSVHKKETADIAAAQTPPQENLSEGWGLEYSLNESYSESQKLSFKAHGMIKTQDGREIKIDLKLNMSRSFASETNFQLRMGDALKDPIVINFDGLGVNLTQDKYEFDIDADGSLDNISFVSPGSGFLALDKNGDGIINDGTELFGPNTQDGFAELAEFDSDENGWIDENDPIFNNLKIWTKDENGNNRLLAIGAMGIGAIYLGNAHAEYDIKDSQNVLQGKIRSTGMYLNEIGTAGTIHQIDLVK